MRAEEEGVRHVQGVPQQGKGQGARLGEGRVEEGRGDAPGSTRLGAKGGGGKGGGAREVGEGPHVAPGQGGKGSTGKGGETPKGGGRGGPAAARPVFAPGTTLYLRDLPQWTDLELAAPLACLQPLAVLTPRSRSGLGAGVGAG